MLYDATNALSHTHAPKHTHPLSQRGEIWTHTDPHLTIYWSFFTIKVILQFFFQECLIEVSKPVENDEVVFVESRNPLIEKYETYCSERNVDPWNCDKHRVNSFINFAYGNLKFKRPDIKKAVVEIEKKHKFKNLSEDPMIKR